ncbi:molecular chaperone [Luteimonas gilva]|uniref:Molecular chaperone n=1 Tax=Luteimonas gilva TaxID=2572684 RepID=A0A4U5K1N5_9GAMM|nr:molecular chaperone [Luteimonas gilva]TKR32839.1 molecular chaperone [Luteimonas gilva]
MGLHAAACLLSLGLCASVHAASLQVSPTSVTLQARQNADGLTLTNTGTAPLHAQVRVFRWTQQGDEEKLEPTRDIAISPPMLQLAPGAQQLVRVIRLGAPPTDVQTGYRLIVDELPVEKSEAKPGLQFVLQYSVPVFLMPQGDASIAPELRARVVREDDRAYIAIGNSGKAHAQVAELAYVAADGSSHTIAAGLSGYVLPGNTRRWPLPATLTVSSSGTFKARINGEPVVQTLPLDPAAP